jgi:hypothetical protein
MHETFSADETTAGSFSLADECSGLASGYRFGGDLGSVEAGHAGSFCPSTAGSCQSNFPNVEVPINDRRTER